MPETTQRVLVVGATKDTIQKKYGLHLATRATDTMLPVSGKYTTLVTYSGQTDKQHGPSNLLPLQDIAAQTDQKYDVVVDENTPIGQSWFARQASDTYSDTPSTMQLAWINFLESSLKVGGLFIAAGRKTLTRTEIKAENPWEIDSYARHNPESGTGTVQVIPTDLVIILNEAMRLHNKRSQFRLVQTFTDYNTSTPDFHIVFQKFTQAKTNADFVDRAIFASEIIAGW